MDNELWRAIMELYRLLSTNELKERAYQEYFENHPVVFDVLGFPCFASFEKSSGNKLPYDKENQTQHEPDFICGNPITQTVTVFELKTPKVEAATTARADGQRAKLRATLESHFSQTSEYINFIGSNLEARKAVADILGMRGVKIIEGTLVYGLADREETQTVAKLAAGRSPSVNVINYDQLWMTMVEAFSRGRPDVILKESENHNTLTGVSFILHAAISDDQPNPKAYILDLGVTSRQVVWLFPEQFRFPTVPFLHCHHRRLSLQN